MHGTAISTCSGSSANDNGICIGCDGGLHVALRTWIAALAAAFASTVRYNADSKAS
jgi:hypothetical protein